MATRVRYLLHWIALPAVLVALASNVAVAGGFQLTPMLMEVPQGQSVATYQVGNTGTHVLNLQVRAYSWSQYDDRESRNEAASLLIVPAILTIAPGRERIVRVALRKQRPGHELDFRLHFDEIPPQNETSYAVGIRPAVSFDVPLFFLADNVRRQFTVQGTLDKSAKLAYTTVKNDGTKYVRISELTILDGDGQRIARQTGPHYALPGVTRHWTLKIFGDIAFKRHPGPYTLLIQAGAERRKIALLTH